ncbi:MAG: hypothetical protein ABIE84_00055 [bacterium]
MKKMFLIAFVVSCSLLVVSLLGCGTTTSSSTATTTTTTLPAGSSSISGQVAATASDITALGITNFSVIKPTFRTMANSGLAGATVKLYQISSDGTETDTTKIATTDANGNYTFSDVDPLSSGIYKIVATKTGDSSTLEITTLAVVNTSTAETANIAPETTIATSMFDDVIKDEFSSNLIVSQSTMKELKNLVTDDTETLVNGGKLELPSMQTTNGVQVGAAAAGIGENNGNAEKAYKKLNLENLANNATADDDQNLATKYINEMILNGSGQNYLPPKEVSKALGQAFLDGSTKTVAEVITAADGATGQSLNSATIVTAFNTRLQELKTKYENLVAGTSDEVITEEEYLSFDVANISTITSATELSVPQQLALKNFIEANYLTGGNTITDITFIDSLDYIASGSPITATSPFFDDVDLYYGSYGGWKVGGSVQIYIPSTPTYESVTVSSVEVLNSSDVVVAVIPEDGGSFRLSNSDGPTVTVGTNRFTVRATLSNAESITTPVTLEMIEIPEPSLYLLDGTQIDDSLAPVGVGEDNTRLTYYMLPTVSDKKPIFTWSTAEVSSLEVPAGYSWAYSTEIFIWGTTLEAETSTLEVQTGVNQDPGTRFSLTETQQSTMEFTNTNDLGALYSNNSFISPVDFQEEIDGQKVAYRFYLQRILLNAEGRYNGIAAGHFRYMRYEP